MPPANQGVPVSMVREGLAPVPESPLPAPYAIRGYRPGDERTWTEIELAAEQVLAITPDLFRREFGADEGELGRRQLFLCAPGGRAVGTSTAWFDNNYRGRRCGRVHWVAIVPEARGLGLAKPLLAATLRRLAELGHDCAVLGTHSYRLPAISLYLRFGFVPDVQGAPEAEAWRRIAERLPAAAALLKERR